MKETIISKPEKDFLLKALEEKRRLDGRKLDEFRTLKIHFGRDWGCCLVSLGETKILAQVSCEVQQPKPTRPNEGLLLLYVELSPMAAPHFEAGRQSEIGVQLNRLLEKCIKDSRCVDLESLCITAEEKVWAVRVDINVLNHEGNLVDAASVAALTALAHFRRPDVTTTGEQTIIHDPAERDAIPITLHHHPVCVTFGLFDNGTYTLADPTALEERVSDGQIVYGVNAYRELCGLHLEGKGQVTTDLVLRYSNEAAKRALEVVTQIRQTLEEDLNARNSGQTVGFREYIENCNLLALRQDSFCVQLNSLGLKEGAKRIAQGKKLKKENEIKTLGSESSESETEVEKKPPVVVKIGEGSAELIDQEQHAVKRKAQPAEDESDSASSSSRAAEQAEGKDEASESDSDLEVVAQFNPKEKQKKLIESIELSGDSEEDETFVLEAQELNEGRVKKVTESTKRKVKQNKPEQAEQAKATSRGWYTKSNW